MLTYGLKYSVNRERPYIAHPDLNVDPAFYESSASFPSGHTSLAFSVATSLSLTHPKWYVIAPAYLWAGSVGYSRLNLGVHYPTDVLAGAVLGAGSAYLTYKANEWYQKNRPKRNLQTQMPFLSTIRNKNISSITYPCFFCSLETKSFQSSSSTGFTSIVFSHTKPIMAATTDPINIEILALLAISMSV